ncbi:MAG: valine--tRNA ligase [Alphaproteobacteria bacterium]
MLDKTYQPAEIEPRIHAEWEGADAFKCGRPERKDAEPFCIVIPPPNVTGSLHMGHALNNTLQDVLCRFERMRGKDVLWQPGTDHAGIATQMVVERQMMERQEPNRQTIGRERFVEKIWAWKEESGNTIFNQLKRLGASCDWSRERFTMDEGLSQAVVKVFVELYNAGLIYKDKRLVNWDPKFQTAISDLEVIQIETKGHLWHFKYPLKDDPEKFIVVATTRPETMLGDTAVAVHPDDERYKDLVGKTVLLPLVGREIPIVADEYSDPEKGSGAVKITPAHDFNDFEVGKRHDLAQINIFDEHARINENAPEAYCGLDRFEARKRIVADIDALGLLDKIEDNVHAVPHGDRSSVPIEPWLTDQWYVDAKTLAAPAIKAIEDGKTVFVPKAWEKTYFEWMRNIQPWCISRQLWWGHQIPAWYGPDGKVFVAADESGAQTAAKKHYKTDVQLERDEDVLDTWFSSGLWAFSTLGWPDETPELKRYYPTSVLVTGFDIIFFWIARMMMLGLHFMKEVPFYTVYIHALVRDASGQKMSKSKGNVMDPLGVIDTYGADALRFTLAAMAAQGRDLKLSTARVEGYRNFATKLWNASRFAEMNECVRQRDFDPANVKEPLNRWIVGETERAARIVTTGLESYKFNEAAGAVYEFVWGIFCDWYLELIKPILTGDDEASKAETRATVAWVLDQILKLLHPFMPFITEELWAHMVEHGEKRRSLLALSDWPSFTGLSDEKVDEEIGWVVRLIGEIRSVRTEMNVPAAAKVPLALPGATVALRERARRHEETISRLARLESISFPKVPPKGAALIVVGETTAALSLAGVIDMGAEMKRLEREIEKAESDLGKMDTKLANPQFLAKAKEAAVEETRERKVELEGTIKRLAAAVTRLQAIG